MSGVAVILATFNGEKWLGQQLASLCTQSYDDWHLYVRDDGSSDATLEVLKKARVPEGKWTVLDPRGGPTGSAAANFFTALCALDLADFGYVAFCDQDDIWAPDKLERAVGLLESRGAGGYSSDLIAFDNAARRAWYVDKSQAEKPFDYIFQGGSAGCTYVLTRAAAELVREKVAPALQTFPRGNSHDWLVYAICRSHGVRWVQDRSAHIFYRQHAVNVYGALPGARGLVARARLGKSGWYREHVAWLRQFMSCSEQEERVLGAVERFRFVDRIWLAVSSGKFRRKRKDAFLLGVSFIFGFF